MGTFLERLLQVIPEAAYDLIARILPGGIIVAAFVPMSIHSDLDGTLKLIVFFVLAYAVGLAVSSLAHVIHLLAWLFPVSQILRIGGVRQRLGEHDAEMAGKWLNPLRAEAALDRIHDRIKQCSTERQIVIKLFAEVSLLYGLTIAMILAPFVTGGWMFFLAAGIIRSARVWFRHESILRAIKDAGDRRTPASCRTYR